MQNTSIHFSDRKAGNLAASALRSAFRNSIKATFKRRTGKLEKSNVTAKYKDENLDRLTITQPHYSFKQHYGSSKKGDTPSISRSGGVVKSFNRHLNGKIIAVNSFTRGAASVKAHQKGIHYKGTGHLGAAIKASQPALEKLATQLGENRAIVIVSKIDF